MHGRVLVHGHRSSAVQLAFDGFSQAGQQSPAMAPAVTWPGKGDDGQGMGTPAVRSCPHGRHFVDASLKMRLGGQPCVHIRAGDRRRHFCNFCPAFRQRLQGIDVQCSFRSGEQCPEIGHRFADAHAIPGAGCAERLGSRGRNGCAGCERSDDAPDLGQEPVGAEPPTCLVTGGLPSTQQKVPRERTLCE